MTPPELLLSAREQRLLSLAASDNVGGLYPGVQADIFRPKVLRKMLTAGLVREYAPSNPVHKYRVVATEKGRIALASQVSSEGSRG